MTILVTRAKERELIRRLVREGIDFPSASVLATGEFSRRNGYELCGVPVIEDFADQVDNGIYFLNNRYLNLCNSLRPEETPEDYWRNAKLRAEADSVDALRYMYGSFEPGPVELAYHYVPIEFTGPKSPFTEAVRANASEGMESMKTALNAQIYGDDDMNGMKSGIAAAPMVVHQDVRENEIRIQRVNNGFDVHVGCQHFVFETLANLNAAIKLFYEDPEKAMKKYMRQPEA